MLSAEIAAGSDSMKRRGLLARRLRQKAAAGAQACPVSHGRNAPLFLHRILRRTPPPFPPRSRGSQAALRHNR
jgi:hypothetical protein